jgi:hypothetical protein
MTAERIMDDRAGFFERQGSGKKGVRHPVIIGAVKGAAASGRLI